MKALENKMPSLLIVDHDPIFRESLLEVAKKRNIPVSAFSSLEELRGNSKPNTFDIAVVDCFEGASRGSGGMEISGISPTIPMVFMSHDAKAAAAKSGSRVTLRKFVNKRRGIDYILDTALLLYWNCIEPAPVSDEK